MSGVGQAFKAALGKPDPKTASGLTFTRASLVETWKSFYREIGAGWFKDRFVYLFGEGLDRLLPCLDAWSFVVPPKPGRMIIGYNAHGSLLVLEDADTIEWHVHVLDPFRVVYWTNANLDFVGLLGYFLPNDAIPHFLDDSVYRTWVKANRRHPADGMVLAPKAPAGLGGEFSVDNFQEEDLLEFYQTSGPIYQKALAKAPAASKPTKGKGKARKR
jgi:hypothetical protein